MQQAAFAFVVLHYKADYVTEKCVDSLLKFNKRVIIVCNKCEKNEYLLSKYAKNDLISFVFNKENLGFAKGINSGFMLAKHKYNANFIVCLNNDVTIEQHNFVEIIQERYNLSKFGVAGPDVINLNNTHQNPRYCEFPTINSLQRDINTLKKRINGCKKFFGFPEIIHSFIKHFKREPVCQKTLMNLHGSCLIFSPIFIDKFDGICDKTFLYGEEEILSYECYINKIKLEYIDSIQILHHESITTKIDYSNLVKRHLFFYENLLNSRYVLLDIVKSNNDTF